MDRSFPTRQPAYCQQLIDTFGADSLRLTRTHAKFILLDNDDWHLVIRTSMNLNENARVENFEISDDPDMHAFMMQLVDEVWDQGDWDESNFEDLSMGKERINKRTDNRKVYKDEFPGDLELDQPGL
ncbi:hypothetical protein HUG15_05675 [Salicibibacter cibarius]|uniref:PLD phosphodiesterase domain-containing protein n=1 Tax=Salicibibacter cibarius TaxID=2743000 RepID=A0A7T6Z1L8_9BACI|nr:hypothetical protein HUG15_05675 [Salicibibacter cibarius]